ncbi:hypothetical protein K402DRAFT_395559 [Aulographum hederae CBS 113979]|uniref:Uncharacterized protein n=1 Tax=Aulographum hederae CBS 113979 TaxID=1176131 RepID=A0A6G1GUT7_9PEZI|nr:hypothetical protein K402DRAFT_395559 [Aulographum hederae CBS 113979]
MDKLKNMASSMGGGSSNTGGSSSTGNNAGKEDYVDKGLDALEKKTGYSQSRETNEKMTDGARDLYEKQTGSKVSDKISN